MADQSRSKRDRRAPKHLLDSSTSNVVNTHTNGNDTTYRPTQNENTVLTETRQSTRKLMPVIGNRLK